MENLSPVVVFNLGPIPVTNTVIMTWFVMSVLVLGSIYLTRGLGVRPTTRRQVVVEYAMGFLIDNANSLGSKGKRYVPWLSTFFLFILISDWLGVIPRLKAPTSDLSTTAALAVLAIVGVWYAGIREGGIGGFLHHFTEPSIILLPINILEQFTRPLSLALRLFGNVWGEEVLGAVVLLLVPYLAPLPVMALDLFTGFLQAYIFLLLVTSYIGGILPHES